MQSFLVDFPSGASGKELPANSGGVRDAGSILGWGRFPWRREWQPTPVFLPGGSCGQWRLAGYSPGDHKDGHN